MGGRRLPGFLSCLLFSVTVLVPILALPSAACATDHGRPYLSGFSGGANAASPFYAVAENAGSATATIKVTAGHCVTQQGSKANYRTENGAALAGQDYEHKEGISGFLCADVDSPQYCENPGGEIPQQTVNVTITPNNSPEDAAVEPFLFRLTSGTPSGLAEPSSAPIHIVDNEGSSRFSLEPTLTGGGAVAYQKTEFGSVSIPVFRAGSGGSGSVGYTVEPDPASPAQPGADFNVTSPNPLPIGGQWGFITIDIVGDKEVEPPESMIITLTGPNLDGPSTTTLTILDNEESGFPKSRFHHPRHGLRYKKKDYRIREMHVFTEDIGGSGVVAAQIALRKNMKNGNCGHWNGSKFKKGPCGGREWQDLGQYEADFFFYRIDPLRPSIKTRIKDYTAWSRAIDGAGNVEKDFEPKRNANTFEVKKRGRR